MNDRITPGTVIRLSPCVQMSGHLRSCGFASGMIGIVCGYDELTMYLMANGMKHRPDEGMYSCLVMNKINMFFVREIEVVFDAS